MTEGPRLSVIGVSGSGKSTVARRAAVRLHVPYIELDAIHHGPNWTEIPDEEFRRIVSTLVAGDAWVMDGNYLAVRDLVRARATTIVWVDPPKWTVMAQVVWRSFIRGITQQELWHGNREEFRRWVNPGHPIRWAWTTYAVRRAQYKAEMDHHWVRLHSRQQVRRWLESLDGRRDIET